MQRRHFLSGVALVCTGCLGATGTTDSPRGTITPDELNDDGQLSVSEFPTFLETADVPHPPDVQSTTYDGAVLAITYESGASDREAVIRQIALVSSSFAELIKHNSKVTRLNADVVDPFGDTTGRYHIEREWAEAVNAGEVSERAYVFRVAETAGIESRG